MTYTAAWLWLIILPGVIILGLAAGIVIWIVSVARKGQGRQPAGAVNQAFPQPNANPYHSGWYGAPTSYGAVPPQAQPLPGWYPYSGPADPSSPGNIPGQLRYWNGYAWEPAQPAHMPPPAASSKPAPHPDHGSPDHGPEAH